MKSFPKISLRLPFCPRKFQVFALLGLAAIGFPASAAGAQEKTLEVGVRPTVTDKSIMWSKKPRAPGEGGHGRVYGIAKVELIRSDQKLAKPVNEGALTTIVMNELDRNGFREFTPGEKPDIVLTVSYGRGELRNPYTRDQGETAGDSRAGAFLQDPAVGAKPEGDARTGHGVSNDSGVTTLVITGASSQQLFDQKSHGYEQKLQRASYEKLYIRIVAWDVPSDPKGKNKMLWKTIMVVDDPDHRDLNTIAAEMLAAGAPFFDKEIDKPEAEIFRPLPEGRVNVGTPEVVDAKSK